MKIVRRVPRWKLILGSVFDPLLLAAPHVWRRLDLKRGMFVVVAVGFVAVMIAPHPQRFTCRAKTSEAKTHLKALYRSELDAHGEFGAFLNLTDLQNYAVDAKVITGAKYYTYGITPSRNHFVATAVNTETPIGSSNVVDVWMLTDASPDVIHVSNGCE